MVILVPEIGHWTEWKHCFSRVFTSFHFFPIWEEGLTWRPPEAVALYVKAESPLPK